MTLPSGLQYKILESGSGKFHPTVDSPCECLYELTRTPRRLRWVRTRYAYQPPALGTYRTHRAALPQGPTYSTYWVRVPASGVGYVPRTVAPQVTRACRSTRA